MSILSKVVTGSFVAWASLSSAVPAQTPRPDSAGRKPQSPPAPVSHAEDATLPSGVAPGWWAKVRESIQKDAYCARWEERSALREPKAAWRAPNPAQGFDAYFTERGARLIRLEDGVPSWEWGLSFAGWGRSVPDAPLPSGGENRTEPRAPLAPDGNRIEYRHDGITEWFVNDERGLEQGFTIPAPPAIPFQDRRGGAPSPPGMAFNEVPQAPPREGAVALPYNLHLDLALTGTLRPVISDDGQAVDFYGTGNFAVIHYASLKVTDATGRVLPARFEGWCGLAPSTLHPPPSTTSGGIRIAIDDTNAVYPITVDPLVTTPAWSVSPGGGTTWFGYSVATAGDVNGDGYSDVIVGAPGYNGDMGEALLYLGGPSGPSTTACWTAVGEAMGDFFGASVATAGDVNGDGYSDVIVGAFGNGGNAGKAYLYLGSASGLSTTPDWTKVGEAAGDYFGSSASTAGDVNGDGYSDVLVGAYQYGGGRGKVYAFPGSASGLGASPSWTATGESATSELGSSVATAGDLNGDGYSDVIVGASGHSSATGSAYVYPGSASGLEATPCWNVTGESNSARLGDSVATAGDVNGDGYSDVAVGSYGYGSLRGRAYVYLGGPSGPSTTAASTFTGDNSNDRLGWSLSTAGDVDGDGYADLLVGVPGLGTDRARLYSGSALGLSSTPTTVLISPHGSPSFFGGSVDTAGDVNGDGRSDVIIGAYLANYADLYLGGSSGLATASSWSHDGEAAGDSFAYSLSSAGDVNGDGYADVLVGADGNNGNVGVAYLVPGTAAGLSATPSWTAAGAGAGDHFGRSVAGVGDINGDGYEDVVVATEYPDSYRGRAVLFLGSAAGLAQTPAWSAVGESVGDSFGHWASGAGDVNGDGYADIVITAHGYGGDTGKAYLYTGGPAGLSDSPAWSVQGEAAGDNFGMSAAAAGDVNRDGYGDLLVGASNHNGAAGRAYVFLGSASGPSIFPDWAADGEAGANYLGRTVASAGDVNGDGYSDVLVSANGYGSVTGRAYVYLGGASGPAVSPLWTGTGSAVGDNYGRGVSSAGDVNGDGYSDIFIGAAGVNGNTGRALVYLGSASGLLASPDWTADGEAAGDYFGRCVARAGDVNGDGYSDVLVGSPYHNASAGKAYAYLGNGGTGMPMLPRQVRSDGSAPIAPQGRAGDGLFRIALTGRTVFGRGRVKLEWQVAPLGGAFASAEMPGWFDSGTGGDVLGTVSFLPAEGPYCWRVRLRYDAVTSPFLSNGHGPWFTLAANGLKEADLRRLPACVLPDEPCWLYSVVKVGSDWTLNWQDPNQGDQRTGWNIRRSNDPGLPKSSWPILGSNVVDMDAGTANYQWTDHSGDDPAPSSVWYYQVTAYNANCPAEGPF